MRGSITDKALQYQRIQVSFDWGQPHSMSVCLLEQTGKQKSIVQEHLLSAGYLQIFVASTETELLELLQLHSCPIVLVDIQPKHPKPFEILQKIHETNMSTCVVVMADSRSAPLAYECLSHGADDYLIRPISFPHVRDLWSSVWRKKKERRALDLLYSERQQSQQKDKLLQGLVRGLGTRTLRILSRIDTVHPQGHLVSRNWKRKRPSEAIIETPLAGVCKKVELVLQEKLSPHVRESLTDVLTTLKSSDVYRPDMSQMIEQLSEVDHTLLERWLSEELGIKKETTGDPQDGPEWEPLSGEEAMLASSTFDLVNLSQDSLLPLCFTMFEELGLIERFQIPKSKLRCFLQVVQESYNSNPYHNFRHAFDVAQALYSFLLAGKALEKLSYVEIFSLLVTALVHDIGHPGVNNAFLIATEASLAVRYNDLSPLENYHSTTAWQLLNEEENNIIASLSPADRVQFRKILTTSIMATDPSKTMEVIGKFDGVVQQYDASDFEHRIFLCHLLIKCADVSNPARPFHTSRYWAEMVQAEFFQQGDKEKEIGLPPSPFMDRESSSLPRLQISFIDFVAKPLYTRLSNFLPDCMEWTNHLTSNRDTWKEYFYQKNMQDSESTTPRRTSIKKS